MEPSVQTHHSETKTWAEIKNWTLHGLSHPGILLHPLLIHHGLRATLPSGSLPDEHALLCLHPSEILQTCSRCREQSEAAYFHVLKNWLSVLATSEVLVQLCFFNFLNLFFRAAQALLWSAELASLRGSCKWWALVRLVTRTQEQGLSGKSSPLLLACGDLRGSWSCLRIYFYFVSLPVICNSNRLSFYSFIQVSVKNAEPSQDWGLSPRASVRNLLVDNLWFNTMADWNVATAALPLES